MIKSCSKQCKAFFLLVLMISGTTLWSQSTHDAHLVVQMGHTNPIEAVCFSPDGKYLVSGAWDETLKLWDVASGKEIKTFTGHRGGVRCTIFSRDGMTVLSGGMDGKLKFWDIKTGNVLRTFAGHKDSVNSIAISPDGKQVLTGSDDKTLKLWDIATGKEVMTMSGHSDSITNVIFLPDGKTALSASGDRSLKLWKPSTGKAIKTFSGHADWICSLVCAPDGKTFFSSSRGSIKEWEIATGQEIRTLVEQPDIVLKDLFIVEGGTILLASKNGILSLIDSRTGQEIRSIPTGSDDVWDAHFSPDGKSVVSGSMDKTLKIWDVASGQKIQSFESHCDVILCVALAHDGKSVFTGSRDNLKKWDLETGQVLKTYGSKFESIHAISIAPDGRTILTGSDKTIKLWDIESGELIRTFTGHTGFVTSVAFGPDGRTLLSGSVDKSVRLWDTANGNEIRNFSGHEGYVNCVAFLPDGKTILSGAGTESYRWDIASGKVLQKLSGIADIAFSPDGKTFLANGSKEVKIYDANRGKLLRTYSGLDSVITSVAFSPDGKFVLAGSRSGSNMLWDAATGKQIQMFSGNSQSMNSVAMSLDGKKVLTGSWDGTLQQWDLSSGKLLVSSLSTAEGEWLAWTPEGFFSGTDWATHNLVHIVDGMDVVGIDQVYDIYYRPDLVAAKIAGKDISANTVDLNRLLEGGLPPVVEILSPVPEQTENRDALVRIRVTDRGGGVGKITIFNGETPVVIGDLEGRGLKNLNTPGLVEGNAAYELETPVSLWVGGNTIKAAAFNKNNTIESRRASVEVNYKRKAAAKPELYVLTVAVQKYRDGDLRLKYTVEDAKSIAGLFKNQSGQLYESVHLVELSDEAVTKEGFAKAFDDLASQVKPDDVFILYFAGHGVSSEKDGEYYFLPVTFRYTSPQSIMEQGISKADITANIVKIPAQKSLLLFDTCNSGAFLSPVSSRGMTEKTAVDRLIKGVGRATILASARDQIALEGIENHGVFTYALLMALRGAADPAKTGFITIKSLASYVESAVPDLTYAKWGYEQVPQSSLPQQDFPLAGVK